MQIPELERRYPDQVSGGQRQRVALARALAIEPRLLLLDEPFGALDALVRKEVRRWLRGLHDRLGITTILVTHDQEEAMEMADRVAVMERGRSCSSTRRRRCSPPPPPPSSPASSARRPGWRAGEHGVLRFGALPLPPLRVAAARRAATAFSAPREVVALPVEANGGTPGGAVIRLLRMTGEGERRAVVELADGVMLDAVVAPATASGWPAKGSACRLQLTGAQVYGTGASRAQAAQLLAALPAIRG